MNEIIVRVKGKVGQFALDVDFTAPMRGVTAVFGPSGSGKSSILRFLAGLAHIKGGFLQVNQDIWQDDQTFIPAYERSVGYVFQEASLFPHMDVRQNLEFGMKRSHQKQVRICFDDVVTLLGIEKLLMRKPSNLSGGERQRVAIGRALLSNPCVLLMDEPMVALDQGSKDEIIPYIDRLRMNLDIPMIYVSHDMHEVQRLCDMMVFLEEGKVQTSGLIEKVLTNASFPMARARDASVIVRANVTGFSRTEGLSKLAIKGATLMVPGCVGDIGQDICVRIAATDVSLACDQPSQTTILNVLPAVVLDVSAISETQYNILCALGDMDGAQIMARISKRSQAHFNFRLGQKIFAQIKGVSMVGK